MTSIPLPLKNSLSSVEHLELIGLRRFGGNELRQESLDWGRPHALTLLRWQQRPAHKHYRLNPTWETQCHFVVKHTQIYIYCASVVQRQTVSRVAAESIGMADHHFLLDLKSLVLS